jgi:hypothetical protein
MRWPVPRISLDAWTDRVATGPGRNGERRSLQAVSRVTRELGAVPTSYS